MGEKKTKKQTANPDVESIEGYEGTSFTQGFMVPPPVNTYEPDEQATGPAAQDLGQLSEAECREALLQFVAENACFGKGCAEDMEITRMEDSTALHYQLNTFTEARKTKLKKKPYKGESIDGPENGPAPLPWEIPCAPANQFQAEKVKKTVPHTEKVKKCKDCHGKGYEDCEPCDETGWKECHSCGGAGQNTREDVDGNTVQEECIACQGSGKNTCLICGGDGKVTCEDCEGYKKLRCFVQLKIKYSVHTDDYYREQTDMPDELIKGVKGSTLFEQTLPLVYGMANFPVQEINDNACRLAAKHKTTWPDQLILMQHQQLRGVPVTEVHYKWKETETRFWIFGTERRVYAPDYPQQTCWGCTLL